MRKQFAIGASVGAFLSAFSLLLPWQAAGQTSASQADEFLVVDCLLPGQIRRLGTRTTYQSARRPIKTTQRDCEIRGGEYVAYDRASYATALRTWLPLAQGGDAAAQTYVGEIYEKGLGVTPDFATAAHWYKEAATKGFSRAAINLGNLFEQGLGVPRDPNTAALWYRRASGLPDVEFGPSLAAKKELDDLRGEVAELRRQLTDREQSLRRAQDELKRVKGQIERTRSERDRQQSELDKLRADLARKKQDVVAEPPNRDEVDRLAGAMREREAALSKQRSELESVKGEVERLRREVAEKEKSVRQGETGQIEIERLRRELAERSAAAESVSRALNAARDGLEAVRRELKARQDELAAASTTTKQLEAAIQQREKALAEKSQEVERLTAALAKSEQDARAREAEFEKIKAAAIAGGPVIQIVEPQIRVQGQRGIGKVRPGDVTVVGRIEAGGGLSKATLDGAPIKLDAENRFSVKLSPGKRARASLSAVDAAGNRETVELGLSPNGELSVVFTGDGSRPPAERQLLGTPLPPQLLRQLGTYHALVIGNNNYKMLPKLETAIDDARVVSTILQRDYGFKVTLLTDATRYDILSALNRLRETLTQEHHLLIYYAGHGELDRVNQRGHWLPVDAEPNSSANWISNIAISDILNAMSVTQLLVVADSCYSGAMTRSAVARLDPGRSGEEKVRLLRIMAQQRSRMVLTSGGLEPVLDGSGSGHSVFAAAFIDALKRNGGALTGQEIHGVVLPSVATTADRFARHHQVPEYAPIKYAGHESGDFIFARVN